MQITDAQVRKLMEELSRHGRIGLAAMRAGIDPRLCKAVVDRLTYRAHIIETGMESDRLSQTIQRLNRSNKP